MDVKDSGKYRSQFSTVGAQAALAVAWVSGLFSLVLCVIVIVNQIGNGLSTSPHNTGDEMIAMSRFPFVTIGDASEGLPEPSLPAFCLPVFPLRGSITV